MFTTLLMILLTIPPNVLRPGVFCGFALLQDPAHGLTPQITGGGLFASGNLYATDVDQALPTAPANQRSWLFYANGSGFYWRNVATPAAAGDAGPVGWVVTDASKILALSQQVIQVGSPTATSPPISGAPLGTLTGPPPITGLVVTESTLLLGDGTVMCRFVATFTAPTGFIGVNIYAVGDGAAGHYPTSPTFVGSGVASGIQWLMPDTGETVTFYFASTALGGVQADILTSPNDGAILDGQTVDPATPTGFAGQTNTGTAGQVLLTWDQNASNPDIKHYELARSNNNTAPLTTDPTFTIPASYNSGLKARYIDTPGAGALYYYVRAVNTSGLNSNWAGPANVTALAPDGSTDTDVPDANYSYAALTIPAPVFGAGLDGTLDLYVQNGLTVLYKSSTFPATNAPVNVGGVKKFNVLLTYTGGDGMGSKVFHFDDNAAVTATLRTFQCQMPNATITDIETWLSNYFGDGVHRSFHFSTSVVIGSKSQDMKMTSATAFNPTTQQIGVGKIEGHAGVVPITINGVGHFSLDRDLDLLSNIRFLIAGSAGVAGQFLQRATSGMRWFDAAAQNGNTLGAALRIGTNDNFPLEFITNYTATGRVSMVIDPNGGSDRLLVGVAIPVSGGLTTQYGSIVAGDVIAAIDGSAGGTMTDASIVSIASSPGIGASPGGCDWSSGKIGTGIVLPARVYIFHTEVMRFDPQSTSSGAASRMLLGLTSTDVSSNLGSLVSVDAICCVDAASNAGLMSMGVAGGAGNLTVYKTGSGTPIPLKIFTGHALSVTVDVSHNMTIVGTLTVQGSGATIGGDVIASGVYHSQTWAGNNAGIFINDTLGNPHLVVGGLVT